MRLTTIALLQVFIALPMALAQHALIGSPLDGATVTRGQSLTVEIDRPDTLSGSREVAVVLGLQYCSPTCRPPDQTLGTILYNGPYNPQFTNPPDSKPPHQNFTVVIPSTATVGKAQLGLVHIALIGAGEDSLFIDPSNVTLNIV